jgi:hypothetical protein
MGRVQRWLRERAVLLGLGGATVAIVSALAIGGARSRKSADEDGPAVIERATVVRTADGGARMLLVESVEHRDETSDWNAYRLSIVRPTDGVLEARTVIGDNASIACEAAVPGRIWCTREGIQLRDASTLAVVADKVRDGDLLAGRSPFVERETGVLHVVTKDGYEVAIDARTLEPKRTQRPAIDRLVILGGSDGTGSTASFTGKGWSFSDGDRRQLLREGSAVGGRTFLLPQIVAVLDGGKAIVVAHKTSLDEKAARWLFTAVSERGETVWESGDENGTLFAVHHDEKAGALAIVVSRAARYMIGLDTKTGRLLYRYDTIRKR